MIIQTNQFIGVDPETLYNAYLNSIEHGRMTSSGEGADLTTWHRPDLKMYHTRGLVMNCGLGDLKTKTDTRFIISERRSFLLFPVN
jgi:hypothetical protein